MKRPIYAAVTSQQQNDAKLNPFALTLIAESVGDDPDRFKGETVLAVSHAHNGAAVYMLLSTTAPTDEQLAAWRAHPGDL